MFTKTTIGLAFILVTASSVLSAAMAAKTQQHPWVPNGATAPTGNLPSDELYNSCHSGHAVFSCPGSGGQ
jgi:hypothetical protein